MHSEDFQPKVFVDLHLIILISMLQSRDDNNHTYRCRKTC